VQVQEPDAAQEPGPGAVQAQAQDAVQVQEPGPTCRRRLYSP